MPRDRQLSEPWDDSTTHNYITDLSGDLDLTHRTRLAVGITHLEARSTAIRQSVGTPIAGAPAGTFGRSLFFEPDTRRHIDAVTASLTSTQVTGPLTHHLFAGVEYYEEGLSAPGAGVGGAASPPINIYNPVFGLVQKPAAFSFTTTTQDLSSVMVSLQDRIDVGRWTVVGGVRHLQQSFLYGAPGTVGVDERRFSPRAGILRHLSESQSVYGSYSTGTAPNQAVSSTNQSLPSRTSSQYELGWKAAWMRGRANSEVSVYRLTQENMLSSDLSTPFAFDQTVTGTARASGLEASLAGRVTDWLSLTGTYAFTDSAYVENALLAGNDTPNVARHTTSLWGVYRFDEQWSATLGLTGRTRRWADDANTTTLPGYGVVDATVGYVWRPSTASPVDVQLAMRNLFDETYYVASHLHVSRWIMPGERRRLMLTATVNLGARP